METEKNSAMKGNHKSNLMSTHIDGFGDSPNELSPFAGAHKRLRYKKAAVRQLRSQSMFIVQAEL